MKIAYCILLHHACAPNKANYINETIISKLEKVEHIFNNFWPGNICIGNTHPASQRRPQLIGKRCLSLKNARGDPRQAVGISKLMNRERNVTTYAVHIDCDCSFRKMTNLQVWYRQKNVDSSTWSHWAANITKMIYKWVSCSILFRDLSGRIHR